MSNEVVAFPELEAQQESWPLIPEGHYEMRLVSQEVRMIFQQPRLVLKLRICEMGPHFGKILFRYYNVERFTKSAKGKVAVMKHKPRGDFMIEYCTLLPGTGRLRLDKVPMTPLYDKVIIGEVVTVKKNNQHKPLPEALQYSKVGRLVKIAN
jgi:hypothetical protein